LQVKLDNK